MVPEDQQQGASLSAPEPTDQSAQPDELEAAESAEGPHGGEVLNSWADLSEGVPDSTAAASGGEGAAFGTPGEISEFEDLPRFDALSLLNPVKGRQTGLCRSEFSGARRPRRSILQCRRNSPGRRTN